MNDSATVDATEHDVEQALAKRSAELAGDIELIPAELRPWWQQYYRTHEAHFRAVLGILGEIGHGTVLEVGSVPGHLTLLMTRLSYPLQGVDLNPDRIGDYFAAHQLSVARVDIEREPLPFADRGFRIAVFTEVLEHLRWNPLYALEEIARVVEPGGSILLSVPNITPVHRLKFLAGGDYQGDIVAEFEKLKWAGHMGHFRLYSKNEVRRMLTHVGFSNIRFRPFVPAGRRFRALPRSISRHFSPRLYVIATRTHGNDS